MIKIITLYFGIFYFIYACSINQPPPINLKNNFSDFSKLSASFSDMISIDSIELLLMASSFDCEVCTNRILKEMIRDGYNEPSKRKLVKGIFLQGHSSDIPPHSESISWIASTTYSPIFTQTNKLLKIQKFPVFIKLNHGKIISIKSIEEL